MMGSLLTSREAEDVAGVGSLLSTLARMVTPPRAVRDFVSREVKQLVGQTRITVPTPAGPISIDPSNPADIAQLKQMATGIKLNVGRQASGTPLEQINQRVSESVPGGWIGIAAAAVGVALLVKAISSPKRRS